ncbi:DUF721 domain-containing protein [Candidatus Acetothermia bacterium]|nr:DUF721 domain-containing protein [Candidatus Acetothermia bacterium]MBI3644036.1 DUF721 domain-containing protein [Candidatus Acetothermia bacterium]
MDKIDLQEIYKVFKRQGLSGEFEEQRSLLFWYEICGVQMSCLTQPLRVRRGILYVETANHVVAQQLNLLKDSYIKKLNQALGEEHIQDLRFRVGSRRYSTKPPVANVEETQSLLSQEEINELLEFTQDERLRSIFERLINTHLRRDRVRKAEGCAPCTICGLYHEGPESICYYCRVERAE